MPWRCRGCGKERMIDLDNLLTWPVDKVISADGFLCECGKKEAVCFMTVSLKDKMRKLLRYPPWHAKFTFLFGKVLKKANGVNRRGAEIAYGTLGCKDLASLR